MNDTNFVVDMYTSTCLSITTPPTWEHTPTGRQKEGVVQSTSNLYAWILIEHAQIGHNDVIIILATWLIFSSRPGT